MVENIKLEDLLKVGGNEWRKENMHRIYFNDMPGLYGVKVTRYNTGNVSSATLDGERISNSAARKILNKLCCGKFWYDVPTGQFMSRGLAESDARILKDAVLERLDGLNVQEQEVTA